MLEQLWAQWRDLNRRQALAPLGSALHAALLQQLKDVSRAIRAERKSRREPRK